MMNTIKKTVLLCAFAEMPYAGAVDHNMISHAQDKLTPNQWSEYAEELRNIMLQDIQTHLKSVSRANLENGSAILFLKASPEQKEEAILKVAGMWEY